MSPTTTITSTNTYTTHSNTNPQRPSPPPVNLPHSTPLHPTLPPDLPTLIRTPSNHLLRPVNDIPTFLHIDLNISRLNTMVPHGLWLAGRIGNIRPLHRQKVLGRRFVITEHLDLHLLWNDDVLFIKPLPSYLLDQDFVRRYLVGNAELAGAVNGFLLSYASLIQYKSDFDIAREERLLPNGMEWDDWRTFFDGRLYDLVNGFQAGTVTCAPRFYFGELRMKRVDWIYRLHPAYRFEYLVRGYCTMPATYQSFLSRHFAWLFVVFAYLTVVLAAMQVGLGTDRLRESTGFNRACYGFTVFSIVLPVVVLVVGAVVSLVLTVYHVGATRRHLKRASCGFEM